jgi:hypothetical protein
MNLFQNIGNWFNNQKQQGYLVRSQREMANQYLQTNPVRPEPQSECSTKIPTRTVNYELYK